MLFSLSYNTMPDHRAVLRRVRYFGFDLDRQILQNNLYGVDLNEEAIEICRLSLWIKTAQRGKQMLDRRDRGAVAVAKHGTQRYAGHRALIGSDLSALGVAVGKEEADPGVPVSGTESDGNWRSAMDSGAG